jgi:hypothetical protein
MSSPSARVFGEVEGGVFEDSDEVGEALDHFLAAAELGGVVEVGHVGETVLLGEGGDDFLIDRVADVGRAL